MLVMLVLNKRLCYGYIILPKLFNISPVAIARKWTVATHGEAAAPGRLIQRTKLIKRVLQEDDQQGSPIVTSANTSHYK